MNFRYLTVLFAIAGLSLPAAAQVFDSSGNSLLNGTYNYRQVVYGNFDNGGGVGKAIAATGQMKFDGAGNYTFNGSVQNSASGASTLTWTGKYSTASSGLTILDSPLFDGEYVYGSVSRGVFIGSTTEGSTNDVVVAIAAGTTPAGTSTFTGSYWLAAMNVTTSTPTFTRDALLSITSNGTGTVNVSSATGYVGAGTTATTQTIASFPYTVTNGSGTLTFPTSSDANALVSGSKTLFVSPDGNFIAGGSSTGYDIFFGIKQGSGLNNASFSGLYFTAGMDQDNSDLAGAGAYFDTYWGSLNAGGAGQTIIRHDRLAYSDQYAYDSIYDSSYSVTSNGLYQRSAFTYAVGASGLGVVGIGKGPYPGFFASVKVRDFTPTGVYISPIGVVNAASNAPFTAGVARGELITIYGSNLASATTIAPGLPFPTTLGNVQVKVNGRNAPIYFVSPTQVSVIVPYATEQSFAQIQITNNGQASNSVTSFVNVAAPGVFTVPAGGLGYAAALHADYSLVSTSNPAQKGETILLYLTGLGDVNPAVTDGAAGPSNPLSRITDQYSAVYVDGATATVGYAGLAPGLAGLYQINLTIPSSVSSGDVYVSIDSTDAYVSQVVIPVK